MNNLIKKIVESKYNFNIDIESDNDILSKSTLQSKSQKLLYDIDQYTVDLGLPSGIRWCKYNIGCDYYLLNNKKKYKGNKLYGEFFAWGETTPKKISYDRCLTPCDFDHYKYSAIVENEEDGNLTKYCNNADCGYNGFIDNLVELEACDDIATIRLGNGYKTPSIDDVNELLDCTLYEWITNYEGKDINGYKFINTEDYSKFIFLPAAGICSDDELASVNTSGNYWTSSIYKSFPCDAYGIGFDYSNVTIYECERYFGFNIRPIFKL